MLEYPNTNTFKFFLIQGKNQMKQRGSTCEIVGDKCSAPREQRPILTNLAGEREWENLKVKRERERERERERFEKCVLVLERERGGP